MAISTTLLALLVAAALLSASANDMPIKVCVEDCNGIRVEKAGVTLQGAATGSCVDNPISGTTGSDGCYTFTPGIQYCFRNAEINECKWEVTSPAGVYSLLVTVEPQRWVETVKKCGACTTSSPYTRQTMTDCGNVEMLGYPSGYPTGTYDPTYAIIIRPTTCNIPLPNCTSSVGGYNCTGDFKDKMPQPTTCTTSQCTREECCEMRQTCASFKWVGTCPAGASYKPLTTVCTSTPCTPEDCCENCSAGGQCPESSVVTSDNFRITNCDTIKKTATVSFTTNLRNGNCQPVSLSWITLAAFAPDANYTDKCVKSAQGSATITGGVTTLTDVSCGSTLSVYAHDGSFKGSTVGSLESVLLKSCRDNSGKFYCGPYGQLQLNCGGGCTLEPVGSPSLAAKPGRRLSSYRKY